MRNFDRSDFIANPKKYELFKTAEIAVNFPTLDVKIGDVVAIEWFGNKPNAFWRDAPLEPVYEVKGMTHYVYASGLRNFVL